MRRTTEKTLMSTHGIDRICSCRRLLKHLFNRRLGRVLARASRLAKSTRTIQTQGREASSLGTKTMHTAQLNRAQAPLDRVGECLEMLTYTVSHDLRAPLRAIDAYSHLVAEEQGDQLSAAARRYLERIQEQVRMAHDMIFNVLHMAGAGVLAVEARRLDLSAMASDIAEQLQARDRTRTVHFDIQQDVTALADPILARQLLQNLLENAWKFTQPCPHARIEFGCQCDGDETVYFVRDNGVGFNPLAAERLFRPFQRLHSSVEFQGTGLGLASAQRIVELHGGRIWANARPGNGACFYLTLSETEQRRS